MLTGWLILYRCWVKLRFMRPDFEKASAWLEESMDDYSRVGNKKAIINDLHSSSWIAWIKGDYVQAHLEVDEALQLNQEIDEKVFIHNEFINEKRHPPFHG